MSDWGDDLRYYGDPPPNPWYNDYYYAQQQPVQRRRQPTLFAPPGYQYNSYLPVVSRSVLPSAVPGGMYPEERALRPEDWQPATFAWEAAPGVSSQVSDLVPTPGRASDSRAVQTFMSDVTGPVASEAESSEGQRTVYDLAQELARYPQQVRQRLMEQAQRAQQAEPGAGAGEGGGQQPPANPAPPGVNQQWWDAFTEEHGGSNPIDYYGETEGAGATKAVQRALEDRAWSEGFAEMYGRPPTDDDWNARWYQRHGLPSGEQQREMQMRRVAREVYGRPAGFARYIQQQQRPPVFIPPGTVWQY